MLTDFVVMISACIAGKSVMKALAIDLATATIEIAEGSSERFSPDGEYIVVWQANGQRWRRRIWRRIGTYGSST